MKRRTADYQIINQALEQEIASHIKAVEALRLSEDNFRRAINESSLGVPFEYTIDIIRKNGEVRNLQVFRKEILWNGEKQFQIIYQDITGRKLVEKKLKDIEGDQVLFRLGQVIKRCLRKEDSAYRYGGEEFTIILPMTTSDEGVVTAERIREELKKENFSPMPNKQVYLTVSIGVAQYKKQEDVKAFVNRVDHLMYQGKKNGKNRTCSDS
ncbi:MAG: GGDEF domain-containing protein [Smithella sp.]